MRKPRVLFLCTGNSCRSQMAEGLCRHLQSEQFDCESAGTQTHGLNPLAVRAMAEIDIDISGHQSKTTAELEGDFDYVVTVCGHASENCPWFPATTRVVHRGFDDPPKLAAGARDEDDAMRHYRRVRDEIEAVIRDLPALLGE